MEMQVIGKNLEVSPAVREYLEKRLSKLSRHLPDLREFKVELRQENTRSPEDRYVAQVTINSAGTYLRGETRAINLFSAVDEIAEVMERQAEKFKTKLYDKGRGTPLRQAPAPQTASPIVRTKRFLVRPLTPEEAVEEMELLGHDFFLFVNSESGELSLVYRRRDGKYGLIVPEPEAS